MPGFSDEAITAILNSRARGELPERGQIVDVSVGNRVEHINFDNWLKTQLRSGRPRGYVGELVPALEKHGYVVEEHFPGMVRLRDESKKIQYPIQAGASTGQERENSHASAARAIPDGFPGRSASTEAHVSPGPAYGAESGGLSLGVAGDFHRREAELSPAPEAQSIPDSFPGRSGPAAGARVSPESAHSAETGAQSPVVTRDDSWQDQFGQLLGAVANGELDPMELLYAPVPPDFDFENQAGSAASIDPSNDFGWEVSAAPATPANDFGWEVPAAPVDPSHSFGYSVGSGTQPHSHSGSASTDGNYSQLPVDYSQPLVDYGQGITLPNSFAQHVWQNQPPLSPAGQFGSHGTGGYPTDRGSTSHPRQAHPDPQLAQLQRLAQQQGRAQPQGRAPGR